MRKVKDKYKEQNKDKNQNQNQYKEKARGVVCLVMSALLLFNQACAPVKKKKQNISKASEVITGTIEIGENYKGQERVLELKDGKFQSEAALVVPAQDTLQVNGIVRIVGKQTGEPAQFARLKVGKGKEVKEVRVDWGHKEVAANGFQGTFTLGEPLTEVQRSQSMVLELPFANTVVTTELRTPPSDIAIESIEVPVNSAVKIRLDSSAEAVMVRRFELKNSSRFPVRVNLSHFVKGSFQRSFGGYQAVQYDGCSGGHNYFRHRAVISEHLVLVPMDYSTDLLNSLDTTLESPRFDAVVPASGKKTLVLFVILPPLYTLENLGTCWEGTGSVVKSCTIVCDLRMPISNECLRSHAEQNPREAVPVTHNIDGHGIQVEDLWPQANLQYADVPANYIQLTTPTQAAPAQVTVNGAIEFASPIGAPFSECKL